MLCQTLKMALGTAAKGEKWAVAMATPKPEFCIPTSIATAFCLAKSIPHKRAKKKPSKNQEHYEERLLQKSANLF